MALFKSREKKRLALPEVPAPEPEPEPVPVPAPVQAQPEPTRNDEAYYEALLEDINARQLNIEAMLSHLYRKLG